MGKPKKGATVTKSTEPAQLGPKPDDVSEGLWKIFLCINDRLIDNGDSIQSVKEDIQSLANTNEKLTQDVDSLEARVSLLEAKVSRNEVINKRQQNEILDLQSRSMKNNVILNFDKGSTNYCNEAEGEDCVALVKHFLINVLGIQAADRYYIPVAHRIGYRKSSLPRAIVAKFPIASELHGVLQQTGRLKNTGHFITKQMPASTRERHQFALNEYMDKRKSPANKARLTGGKLYMKGKLQNKYLPPDVSVDPNYEAQTDISIEASDPVTDSGSIFQGYAAKVSNDPDVASTLEQSLELDGVATATHRIFAFRYDDGHGINENFDSDGDDGIGLKLLRSMQEDGITNQLWIVTRTCLPNFTHIGNRRFTHAISVCNTAAKKLADVTE